MSKVLWIGPLDNGEEVQHAFFRAGLEMLRVNTVDAALEAATRATIPVAFVSLDGPGAFRVLENFTRGRPEVQIIGVTSRSVPPHIALALQAGVGDVVNLRLDQADELAARAQAALRRHLERVRELEFLRRVHSLNEEFLQNTIALERRNMELEHEIEREVHQRSIGADFRILVIDDEPTVLQLFEMILEGRGFEIVTAATGEEGLAAFAVEPFQLVVTDKNLPKMSGLEVLREVKKLRPQTDVVMITGYGSKDSAVDALNRGAIAYLEKPFDDVDAVSGTLDVIIDKHRLRSRTRDYLEVFKERNREFLDRYRSLRADLERRIGETKERPTTGRR